MFNLKNVTVLTKAQQKNVRGGGTCSAQLGEHVYHNLSREEAIEMASVNGQHWCCDSCDEATWMK